MSANQDMGDRFAATRFRPLRGSSRVPRLAGSRFNRAQGCSR